MNKHQQVCVGGFIVNSKNEVLLVRRSPHDNFLPGYWELPGGGTKYGEKPEAALQREIREECGIGVKVLYPLTTGNYYMKRKSEKIQRVEITYLCKPLGARPTIRLSKEHGAFAWAKSNNMARFKLSKLMKRTIGACNGRLY